MTDGAIPIPDHGLTAAEIRTLIATALDHAGAAAVLRSRLREIAAQTDPDSRKATEGVAEIARFLGEVVGIDVDAELPQLSAVVQDHLRFEALAFDLKVMIAGGAAQLASGKFSARQAGRWQLGAALTLAQHLGVVAPNLKAADDVLDALADLDRGRVDPILTPLPRPTFDEGKTKVGYIDTGRSKEVPELSIAGQAKGGRTPRIAYKELDELCLAAALVTTLLAHAGYRLEDAAAHVAAEMTRRGAAYTAERIKRFRAAEPMASAALDKHIKAAKAFDDHMARIDAAKAAHQNSLWLDKTKATLWPGPAAEEDDPFVLPDAAFTTVRVTPETAARRHYDSAAYHVEERYRRLRLESWLPPREAALLAVETVLNNAPQFADVAPLPEIAAILDRSDAEAAQRSG